MFPNIVRILSIIITRPATSASVERANSALRYVKTDFRSTMLEGRLNALLLLYLHSDIKLDYKKYYSHVCYALSEKNGFKKPIN